MPIIVKLCMAIRGSTIGEERGTWVKHRKQASKVKGPCFKFNFVNPVASIRHQTKEQPSSNKHSHVRMNRRPHLPAHASIPVCHKSSKQLSLMTLKFDPPLPVSSGRAG